MHDWVFVLFGVLALLTVAVGMSIALVVVIAVRLLTEARSRVVATVEHARLKARAYTLGPVAEVARLRLDLRASVAAARRALACAVAASWPVGDAASLVRRLEVAAAGVDVELRSLELEADPAHLTAVLPVLRSRTASVCNSAAGLRRALLDSSLRVSESEIAALDADCAVEARALRAPIRVLG